MYALDDEFDLNEQTEVLRLLASRSPRASGEAARALRATSGAGRQLRIDRLVPIALGDHDADFSTEERSRLMFAMGTLIDPSGLRRAPRHAPDNS